MEGGKDEGEPPAGGHQGALLLLLRRPLAHPPLHARLCQAAGYGAVPYRMLPIFPSVGDPDPIGNLSAGSGSRSGINSFGFG